MEEREGSATPGAPAVPLVPAPPAVAEGAEARNEAPRQASAAAPAAAQEGVNLAVGAPGKKKRGRPRKYAPDGSLLAPLNPKPISASAPAGGEYPAMGAKRGRGRPGDLVKRSQLWFESESPGEMVTCFAGANFTPHVISVAAGEDVTMKIISFSQQGPRAICILSATGVISNVTLRQSYSSGGTLTYEGLFELLSLSGSFSPTDNGGTRSRHGGMSVSLASPDGRVIGGNLAGLLVAAGPVQVVIGSFMPGFQMEQKMKRPKYETPSVSTHTAAVPILSAATEGAFSVEHVQQRSSVTLKPTLAISSPFKGENWTYSPHSVPNTRNSATDINISLPSG